MSSTSVTVEPSGATSEAKGSTSSSKPEEFSIVTPVKFTKAVEAAAGNSFNEEVLAVFMMIETAHRHFVRDDGSIAKWEPHLTVKEFMQFAAQDWVVIRHANWSPEVQVRLCAATLKAIKLATAEERAKTRKLLLNPTVPR
jgi:hypothetical protein